FAPIWGTFPLTETWTVNADGSVASTDTSLCSDAWSADPWYCAAGQSGVNILHWLKQNSTTQRHESMPLTGTPPDGAHMSARATAYTVDQTLVASGSGAQPYDSDMWFGWSFAGR
ncbi:MAG: hypothetical protein PUF51_01035, partial [Bifidobacteriaceae bacterium]|nr:hypothetical protein [Bifidobacteriaceae bacterium]